MRFVPAGATAKASVETVAIDAMPMINEAAIRTVVRSDMTNSSLIIAKSTLR
jgi:hypothetical protein